MTPLGWLLNAKTITDQYTNLCCILGRVPICILTKKTKIVINFLNLLNNTNLNINQLFNLKSFEDIQKDLPEFNWIKNMLLYYKSQYKLGEGNRIIERLVGDKELENAVYRDTYANGQYTGMVSPQANDFYQDNIANNTSDFNSTSFLKCLFQIAFLGNIYSTDTPTNTYTLSNAIVIIAAFNNNIKYTGKYWYKPIVHSGDKENTPTTLDIVNRIFKRIRDDEPLIQKISEEFGGNLNIVWSDIEDKNLYGRPKTELSEKNFENKKIKTAFHNSINLFKCTTGIESFLKTEFALTFSGIMGHHWDYFLRFFEFFDTTKQTDKEISEFKIQYPSFVFIKHHGTPIASYLYDFTNGTQNDVLVGYNSINFGRIINENLISIKSRITKKTIYTPQSIPNCLIPIVFDNSLLQCTTSCYRSYKAILRYMKSRKQRDFLFDRLTQFGRRAMTILDPYGIFMHFHNDQKGLVGNWRGEVQDDELLGEPKITLGMKLNEDDDEDDEEEEKEDEIRPLIKIKDSKRIKLTRKESGQSEISKSSMKSKKNFKDKAKDLLKDAKKYNKNLNMDDEDDIDNNNNNATIINNMTIEDANPFSNSTNYIENYKRRNKTGFKDASNELWKMTSTTTNNIIKLANTIKGIANIYTAYTLIRNFGRNRFRDNRQAPIQPQLPEPIDENLGIGRGEL